MEEIRLNKFISEAGVCSRREADRRIEEGRVRVDGIVAAVGTRIHPGQRVEVDGQLISREEERIFLAVHKPKGIVCTADPREKDNLIDFLHFPKKITYLGRLDKDSTGLIIMTNDGEINNRMMRARNHHEKEYQVTVDRPVTEAFLEGMAAGVPILDTVTRRCRIWKTGEKSFQIVLTQGLNRQIRRMCEHFGYRVKRLHRVRVMNVTLGDLPVGAYRYLTAEEIAELERLTAADTEKQGAGRSGASQNRS